MKEKLTSRKFLVAVAGIITGIILMLTGNTGEGATTLTASILGYLVAEGYIDAKAVSAVLKIEEGTLVESEAEEKVE